MELVMGNGPKPCEIMVIGEAPGANEQEQGIPFIGSAGKILNQALEEAEIPRESVYVTNVYKLRPPGNRKPTWDEINSQFDLLIKEILEVSPKYVILLGGTALEALSGNKGISQYHGTRLWNPHKTSMLDLPLIDYPDLALMLANPKNYWYCTYHPAATIYNKDTKADFFADVKNFGKIARGMYTLPGVNDD